MKYWLLKGTSTPAHKKLAKANACRIIDARFADRFKGKDVKLFNPTKDDLAAIDKLNEPKEKKVVATEPTYKK